MKIIYLQKIRGRSMQTLGLMMFFILALSSQSFGQSRTVSGILTDGSSNDPLIGATITVQGTTIGTITDIDGSFSLDVPSNNSVLQVSYVGYTPQEITVGNQSNFNLAMAPDAKTLDEIVVVGYGTQRKRDVTAAISTLTGENINAIPVASSVDAMKGQVAGVDVQATGGRPGQNPSVQIRGRRSIGASNDPLYVIDGIPQTSSAGEGAIFDINPQDIKSMEVLKDAAATAIYGSRGANGVILITTNRGAEGKTTVTYDAFYGTTTPTSTVDMMNGEEFAAMKRESRRRDANGQVAYDGTIVGDAQIFEDAVEIESIAQNRTTDYQDLVFGSGWKTNHQLSVNGGTAKTQFNFSLGYFNEQGFISNMDFNRITGRINLDHQISDIFKTGISFLATNSTTNWGSNATMQESLANNPLGVPFDAEGNLRFLPTNDGIRTNPLNELVENAYVDERRATRLFAPIYVNVDLGSVVEGLDFRSTFGPDIRIRRRGEFRASLTNDNRGGPADAEIENGTDIGYTLENLLSYGREIGGGNLKVTLLQSIQKLTDEFSKAEVLNLPYESQLFYNIGTAEVKGNLSSGLEEWQLSSFMGRVNYDIAGKYLFQVSLRADGSSRLAEGNKWAYFPGVSFGWRIIDEPFMADNSLFDDLKLRASYGEVGNTSIDPYQTLGGLQRTTYAFGDAAAFGFALQDIPNSDLGWEVSKTIDIGLDYSLGNGRFNGSLDWYSTKTSDILLARNLPYTSGYQSVLQNIGSTASSGLEFNINAGVVSNPSGFNWDLGFNIAGYKEEITDLALKDADGNSLDDVGNGWFIGSPIQVWYDYEFEGIYQSNEVDLASSREDKQPGEIKLIDQDGDGVITPDDRKILGSDVPDFYGGIRNSFSYKGFDLNAYIYFRQGHMIRSRFHDSNNSLFARYNNLDVNYWTIDNPSNEAPRPNENQERPRNGSTLTYFDGSYIKLRNVTLGYSLPTSIVESSPFSRLRFYVSGENLWFGTSYETFDPESGSEASSSDVPSNRSVIFGLKASF